MPDAACRCKNADFKHRSLWSSGKLNKVGLLLRTLV